MLSHFSNIIYLDNLSFSSLLSVIFSRINYSHIFYFNASIGAEKMAKIFLKARVLKTKPMLADFYFANIRDEKGECQFVRILNDVRDISFNISDKKFVNNSFLKKNSQQFDFRKILLFFEKTVAEEIKDDIIFINVAKWHAKDVAQGKKIVFFLEKNMWSDFLEHYVIGFNIVPYQYRSMLEYTCSRYFLKVKNSILARAKLKLNIFEESMGSAKEKTSEIIPDKKLPVVSAWYTGKTITFNLKERSDFFWLLKSDIPRSQVLIYFDREDVPLPTDIVDILTKEGVKFLTLSPKIMASNCILGWQIRKKSKKLFKYTIKFIFENFPFNITKFNFTSPFFFINMLIFIMQYSYWFNFFSSCNVKVHIGPNDFSRFCIPKNLALEKCGGVSISYQWSNLNFSFLELSNYSNVMFSFSHDYRWVWEKNKSVVDNFVYCGYITDYVFKEVRGGAIEMRNDLHKKDVKFIICFFDENSSDDRMSIILNEQSARIYKFFIEMVLEDKTLGLIFKPGYPTSVYKRLSLISEIIKKGKESGRCIFIDKGTYVTEKYPAEAAQAADLCVGLLLSGTAALESYLSGTPTIFLDLEKLYSHPIYEWGKSKVVFDNLDELFYAIQKFRVNPAGMPGFGDISSWVKNKDFFKDGNASLRIGQYLYWLFEMFNQGLTREEAIRYANQKYTQIWGNANVSTGYCDDARLGKVEKMV